ncbi:MAG TPA: alginate export family protein [Thermodesulfovibrionales bacterium]|nr:alginate export family protein [Thermodesulfovibrionales bacterium]
MKKYLAILLGAVFVLGFAASAFAIHAEIPAETQAAVAMGGTQITIGGDIRIRGFAGENTTTFKNGTSDNPTYYDERVRLSVDAKLTPNTEAFIMIEAANGPTSTSYTWGGSPYSNGAAGIYQYGDSKRATLNLLEAWILYKGSGLLGIPAGIKVGHMPLALGNKVFFDHTLFGDDAIVLFADPTKEMHLVALTAKFMEGNTTKSDDANAYVGIFDYRTKEFGVSFDVTYVDHQNSFYNNDGGADDPAGPLPVGTDAHLWNFGLRGDVTVLNALNIYADLEGQTGKIEDLAPLQNEKFKGYAILVGASYKLDPVKFLLEWGYGSGDDNPTDGSFKEYVTSLSAYQRDTFVYNYNAVGAGNIAGAPVKDGGLANTNRIRFGIDADLTKELFANVTYYYLHANKLTPNMTAVGANHTIGSEIDWLFKYKLDKNLVYYVEGGYLFAGDYYKVVTGGKTPDDAWGVRQGLQVTF